MIKFFACFFCLKLLAEIGCFVCICILCSLSSKNPFENHTIGNLSNYFYEPVNTTSSIINKAKYNNERNTHPKRKKHLNVESKNKYFYETVNTASPTINKTKHKNDRIIHPKRKKHINVESKNIPSDKKIKRKNFVRKLVSDSFCSEIHDNFAKYKGKKLSNIFFLNYRRIFKISIANLVISCSIVLFCILFLFLRIKLRDFGPLFDLFLTLLYVSRFILSLILFYFLGKSDIEKYDDFLDCKNVKVKSFNKFSDVNKLRKCFIAFLILNIIIQGIDQFEKCCECQFKSLEEKEEPYGFYNRHLNMKGSY